MDGAREITLENFFLESGLCNLKGASVHQTEISEIPRTLKKGVVTCFREGSSQSSDQLLD